MPAPHVAKTSDPLGRYYTDPLMAALLATAMAEVLGSRKPARVLDLGAGAGALVEAVAQHWPAAQYQTVDVDPAAQSALLSTRWGPAFSHHHGSALDARLADDLVRGGYFDAAVCNPPYIRLAAEPHFAFIAEQAGLSDAWPCGRQLPSDILFIAQNLRLLAPGGVLGLILPDGVAAGERYQALRRALITQHRLAAVIEMPRRVFKNTDAKAHILVLEKNAFEERTLAVRRVEAGGTLSEPIALTAEQAIERLDYSFYVGAAAHPSEACLESLGATVWRGRISSADRKALGFPVFHTSDFDGGAAVPSRFALTPSQASHSRGAVAMPGDILLARIGRTLEQKVCQVATGPVAISDSVLALRLPVESAGAVYEFLTSSEGRSALAALAHGVAARFITAGALMRDLSIPR